VQLIYSAPTVISEISNKKQSFFHFLSPSPGIRADYSLLQPSPPLLESAKIIFSEPVAAAFVAGGVAGAVSRTVVSPLERLKILLQVQSAGRNEYKLSVWKGLVKMWREEGWKGFMRGNGTNCVRIIPYSAVQFGSYNFYKRVSSTLNRDVLSWWKCPRPVWLTDG
jgi:solute carrier family 25 (mitochondrial phosphate transporter), member 23/24/25/41